MHFPSIRLRHSRLRAQVIVCSSLAAAAATSGPARAQDPPADPQVARAHYVRGEALFRREQYQDAYQEFEAGYNLSRRPLFLVNMAHAQRRQGALERAEALYRRFLLVAPDSPLRAQVESVLEQIEQVHAAEGAHAPAAPAASLDGSAARADIVPAATVAAAEVPPASAPGRGASETPAQPSASPRALDLEYDGNRPPRRLRVPVSVTRRADQEVPARPSRFYRKPWFWALTGALIAGAAGIGWAFRPGQPGGTGTLGTLGASR